MFIRQFYWFFSPLWGISKSGSVCEKEIYDSIDEQKNSTLRVPFDKMDDAINERWNFF